MFLLILAALTLTPLAAAGPASAANSAAAPTAAGNSRYIVELSPSAGDPAAAAADLARQYGLSVGHIYRNALFGFSASIPAEALKAVAADRRVAQITADAEIRPNLPRPEPMPQSRAFPDTGQTTPPGISRIQAPENAIFQSNPVDADVAVIDTGVWAGHPDLNVVGGVNCVAGEENIDYFGHGTHVAGIIGALDNTIGVVGVAPGVRLWSVKVLNKDGFGTMSDIVCGIDWVTANASVIEVANMSLGGNLPMKAEDGKCGRTIGDAEHEAICASVRAGVTYVVAAGNNCGNADYFAPGGYKEVITVAAMTDTDGQPGAYGPAGVTRNCGVYDKDGVLVNDRQPLPNPDDAIAAYTNTGKSIDIWAPGTNVLSTFPMDTHVSNRPYAVLSGTSMATPHVTGVVALMLRDNPALTPEQVRSQLRAQAER
ncbi:MAG: S8 family peptidase, partial [Thermomicrobiales bacterium]